MRFSIRPFVVVLGCLLFACGCTRNPFNLQPVSGTVKYEDGTVPEGEYGLVRLEPVAPHKDKYSPRAGTGQLMPDGKFDLMTFKPADGIIPGTYRVVLLIWKTYRGHEPVIPRAYSNAETTPIEPIVVNVGQNRFDFVIQKDLPNR